MATDLPSILAAARQQRDAGAWQAGARLYATALQQDPGSAEIRHNLALCHIGMGGLDRALQLTTEALAQRPDLWQSGLLQAKIFRARGETESTEGALRGVLRHAPGNGHALLGLADIEMNEYGDAYGAISRVAPLVSDPAHAREAELTRLMAGLYDRDEDDATLSARLRDFARRHLTLPGFRFQPPAAARAPISRDNDNGRPRVALLSPLFCAGPVYYFTIGALRLLARDVDLVFLNRGMRQDWATRAFRAIGKEWHELAHVSAENLANFIKAQAIDVLFDLGGWMDPIGMTALTVRPAPRQYKWVGGQSATTGLDCFDGFITDAEQSPAGSEALHSEPLIRLSGGYVSYEPDFDPGDIALPDPADAARSGFGVIGNPAKISRAFLAHLAMLLDDSVATDVLLIDRRYRYPAARRRIAEAMPARHRARLHFEAPEGHRAYLAAIRRPARLIDTFPYNGGLTTVEAMMLSKPIEFRSGQLFASRHSMSHYHFWNSKTSTNTIALRRDHARLAGALRGMIKV